MEQKGFIHPKKSISDLLNWSIEDVSNWLIQNQLNNYTKIFIQNQVDGKRYLEVIDDLAKLGITSYHNDLQKMTALDVEYRKTQGENPSSHNLKKIIQNLKVEKKKDNLFASAALDLLEDGGIVKGLKLIQDYPERFPITIQKDLGFCYLYGHGVPMDVIEGKRLLKLAKKSENESQEEKKKQISHVNLVSSSTNTLESSTASTNLPLQLPMETATLSSDELKDDRPVDPEKIIFDDIQSKDKDINSLKNWIETSGIYANLEAKHPEFRIPLLYHASRSNNILAVQLLLEMKANVNSQESPVRSTALHISNYKGFVDITKLLLEYRADPYLRNNHGETTFENGTNGSNPKEIPPILKEYEKSFGKMEISDPDVNTSDEIVSLQNLDDQISSQQSISSTINNNIPSILTPTNLDLLKECKNVNDWSVDDVINWLPKTVQWNTKKFKDNDVNGSTFLSFNESELKKYMYEPISLDIFRNVNIWIQKHQPRYPKDPEQLWQMGVSYANGTNVPQNFQTACKLFQIAAIQGHPNALNSLGYCYYTGKGVEQDLKEAVRLYRLAAQKNNKFAACNLGRLYKKGQIVEQDLKAAFEYFKIAADQGHPVAQYNVGNFYLNGGGGVTQNQEEALKYYRMADKQGDSKSKQAISFTFENEKKKVRQWSIDDVIKWLQKTVPCDVKKLREDVVDGKTFMSLDEKEIKKYVYGAENIQIVFNFIHHGQQTQELISQEQNENLLEDTNMTCKNDTSRIPLFSAGLTLNENIIIDFNLLTLTDIQTLFQVNQTCSPCSETLKAFVRIHRQCKKCTASRSISQNNFSSSSSLTISNPFDSDSSKLIHISSPNPYLHSDMDVKKYSFIPAVSTSSSSSFSTSDSNSMFPLTHTQCATPHISSNQRLNINNKLQGTLHVGTSNSSSSMTSGEFDIKWSIVEVCKWLERNNLHQYIDKFKEYKIDGKRFKNLVPLDFKQIGVTNWKDNLILKYVSDMNKDIKTSKEPLDDAEEIVLEPPITKKKKTKADQTLTDYQHILKTKNWKDRLFIAMQIAEKIFALHEHNKVHGNICCKNILLTKEKWELIQDSKDNVEPVWTAPELILIKNISSKEADVFSFAFILYYLWVAENPWEELSRKSICDHLGLGIRPEFSSNIPAPDQYRELIAKCWLQEAKNRIPMKNIVMDLKEMSDHISPLLEALLVASALPQGLEKYKIIKFISSTFTCLIQDKVTEQQYAMKIRKTLISPDKYEEEHKILLKLASSQYLIQFQEGFLWDFQGDWGVKWCLVYHYYWKGTLQANIVSAKQRKTITNKGFKEDERQIVDWASQLCEGLLFLHDQGIVHRNVKSSKIYLDQYNIAKLGDIGLTKDMEEDLKFSLITRETNTSALGIIILELLTFTVGIGEVGWEHYLQNIPQYFSPEWKDIVEKLLDTNLLRKSTLNELLIALRDIRNEVVSPLQENEGVVHSALNRSETITSTSDKKYEERSLSNPKPEGHPFQSGKMGGKFACDFPGCQNVYGKKYTLNRHKKIHLSSTHVCRWCLKSFADDYSLKHHVLSHSKNAKKRHK